MYVLTCLPVDTDHGLTYAMMIYMVIAKILLHNNHLGYGLSELHKYMQMTPNRGLTEAVCAMHNLSGLLEKNR